MNSLVSVDLCLHRLKNIAPGLTFPRLGSWSLPDESAVSPGPRSAPASVGVQESINIISYTRISSTFLHFWINSELEHESKGMQINTFDIRSANFPS